MAGARGASTIALLLMLLSAAPAITFVHPGALESRAQLDYVKAKVQARAQPWSAWYAKAVASPYAVKAPSESAGRPTLHADNWPCCAGGRTWDGCVVIRCTPDGKPPPGSIYFEASQAGDDATGAYVQALLWWYSGGEAYAKRSVAILNAWGGLRREHHRARRPEGAHGGVPRRRLRAGGRDSQ